MAANKAAPCGAATNRHRQANRLFLMLLYQALIVKMRREDMKAVAELVGKKSCESV
jgi:hypothetical protein